jgi:Phosphomannomutase
MENQELIKQVTEKAEKWLSPAYDAETQAEVKKMLENEDKTELIESFYKDLEFGTGGLRGIMGSGSNRMNIYTVGGATQGLSNYLNKNFKELKQISVVVGHDCRNNSRKFAEISANIFLGQWHQGLFVRSPSSNTRDLICYSSSGMSERHCDYSFSQP